MGFTTCEGFRSKVLDNADKLSFDRKSTISGSFIETHFLWRKNHKNRTRIEFLRHRKRRPMNDPLMAELPWCRNRDRRHGFYVAFAQPCLLNPGSWGVIQLMSHSCWQPNARHPVFSSQTCLIRICWFQMCEKLSERCPVGNRTRNLNRGTQACWLVCN